MHFLDFKIHSALLFSFINFFDNNDILQIGLISTRFALWLVRSSPDLASGPGSSSGRDIVLCSWAKHITLTVPLSTQVYKCELNAGDNPEME